VIRLAPIIGILSALLASAEASRAEPSIPVAVFDVVLINTAEVSSTPAELERARALERQLRDALSHSGRYRVVELSPGDAALDLRHCNGCELPVARQAGATETVITWVHKVSELILNINMEIDDATTGARLRSGSVDIRGNTDESWTRGLSYLLENQILADPDGKKE
jgi:hypothetical protein